MADNRAGEEPERSEVLCVCPLQPPLSGPGACPPAPLMRNDADHAATGISCANIRKAVSGMLLKASCVRACERVWVRTRVPNWHVLLPAELAWAALGDRAGVSRGALCSPQCMCSPAGMFSRLLCCSLRAFHPVCQGRGKWERKAGCFLLPVGTGTGTAPPWRGTGGSPCCSPVLADCAHGCSTCMDSPTSEKPYCTCGVILQLALKKHWKSSSKS